MFGVFVLLGVLDGVELCSIEEAVDDFVFGVVEEEVAVVVDQVGEAPLGLGREVST
jgi:hypothetical protein